MIKQHTGWKFREDELTMKEFYNLSQQDKEEYLLLIKGLKEEERSSMDIILLNRFGLIKSESKKFLSLEDPD
jgi:hypothetical protein